MGRIIFLSIVFTFLSFSVNSKEVLAAGEKKAVTYTLPSSKDPRLTPGKYCDSKCTPTVYPVAALDAKLDAAELRKDIDLLHTRKGVITHIATLRSNAQRLEIAEVYNDTYRRDLVQDIRHEISGDYKDIIMGLMTPFPVYLAQQLHNNMAQKGTDERMLVENVCSLSNYGIKTMAEFYLSLYGVTLEEDVKRETTGPFQKLVLSLINGTKNEKQAVDNAKIVADAQALLKSKGEKNWVTEKSQLVEILSTRNHEQLKRIFLEYDKIAKREIERDISEQIVDKPARDGLNEFVKCARSKVAFLAERLRTSMKGPGTREATLSRVLVSRSEIDLEDVKNAYMDLYKGSLESRIRDDTTSNDYRATLIGLVRGNQQLKQG